MWWAQVLSHSVSDRSSFEGETPFNELLRSVWKLVG